MLTFDKLTNRYLIQATLRSEGGLHIGTGVGSATTDQPFVRMGGASYIPGSSLRGVLRSLADRLVPAVLTAVKCCSTFDPQPPCHSSETDARVLERLARENKLYFCPMCRFFGSVAIASRFKISDAVQTTTHPRQPVRRDGVGIDRDTETARDQIKYDFEVLEPGVAFRLTSHLENLGDSDKAILYMLLLEMKNGIDVGGKRSRGLGLVILDPEYKVSFFDQDGSYGLDAYLHEGKLKDTTVKEFEDDLRAAFYRFVHSTSGGNYAAARVA